MERKKVVLIIVEDDNGHAKLIRKNLIRNGIINEIIFFKDGQEVLDFLFRTGEGPHRQHGIAYLLLLDIRMPRVNGVEVLRQIKSDDELRKMPVVMVTTTDDPMEIDECHSLGCSNYITKPVDYDKFVEVIKQLGLFLLIVEVPKINGE